MVKFLIFCSLFLFVHVHVNTQTIDELESQGYTVLDSTETAKMLVILYEHQSLKQQVATADSIIANYREQITTLKNIYNIRTQIPPAKTEPKFIQWQGFNVGIGTYYVFDSTLTSSTVVNRLVNKGFLYGEARFVIQDKLIFTGECGIPFESKMYLRATVGYRIW